MTVADPPWLTRLCKCGHTFGAHMVVENEGETELCMEFGGCERDCEQFEEAEGQADRPMEGSGW